MMKVQLTQSKLGYGGTKSEMERLLADATELSGVEYNLDNLGDVYSAIHVIQEDLGLTGVAAEEASTTFTGSMGAMQAAAQNLMANLALGEDISSSLDVLGQTVQTFLFNNLFPMIGNIVSAVPELLSGLSSMLIQSLNMVSNNADEIVQQGIEIVTALVSAIVEAAPYLVEAAFSLITSLGQAFMEADWATIGNNLINELRSSIDLAAGEILGTDGNLISSLMNGITTNLPMLLESAAEIITELANGFLVNAPMMITTAGELITTFVNGFLTNGTSLLTVGTSMISNIIQGITTNLPNIIASAQTVFTNFLNAITQNLPGLLTAGVGFISTIVNGILSNLPTLITGALQVITTFVGFLLQNLPTILEAGASLILELVNGIISNLPEIVSAATEGIMQYISTIGSMLPDVLKKGIEIIGELVAGLIKAIPDIIAAIPQIIAGITETLMEFDWLGIGSDIITGIANGITNAGSSILNALWDSVNAAIEWVKKKLHIESPSKYMADVIGKNMALGIGVGFEDNMPETELANTVMRTTNAMETAIDDGVGGNGLGISYEAIYQAIKEGAEAAELALYIDGREATRTLKSLGVAMV